MKYIWQDLPERLNVFTTRNTFLLDLRTRKIVQHYASNTRLTVVQKCVTPEKTYYRTESAARHGLDWAFEATAFGLPNEEAPSASEKNPNSPQSEGPQPPCKKQISSKTANASKDGERLKRANFWKRLFRK